MLRGKIQARGAVVARAARLNPANPAYPWLVLFSAGATMVMSVLDQTIVNVAIAKLEVVFGTSTDTVQWVITAYLLAYAIMLGASGWLADRFGYKKVYLAAIGLFTVGSLLCSLAWNVNSLILFRVVQGIGGGMMAPVSLAIIMREFPPERRGLAMGIYSVFAIAFSTFGPTLGGWILDNFSWHLMFDINVPIGCLGLLASAVIFREFRGEPTHTFDLAGFVGLALFLGAALLALADGNASWNTDGWHSSFTTVCFTIAGAGLFIFFASELTSEHPLIDLSLFRNYNFSLSSVVMFVFGLGIFGSDFLLPLYLQIAVGYTPFQTGLLFLPMGIAMAVAGVAGGRLTDRIGGKIPGTIGILLRAYGMYRLTSLTPYSDPHQIMGIAVIMGAGMGLIMSPLQTMLIGGLPNAKLAQASGLIKIVQQLGGSFGVALLSTILTHRERFHLAMLGQAMSPNAPAVRNVIARLTSAAFHHGATAAGAAADANAVIMSQIQTHAFVASIDDVFFLAMIVSVVSSIPFLFLKSYRARRSVGEMPVVEAATAKG